MERLRGLQAKDTLKQSIKANDPQCCHRNCDGNNGYCRQSSADAAVTGCSACAQELADQLSSRSRLSSAALPSYSPLLSERQQRQHLLPGWKCTVFWLVKTFCATTPVARLKVYFDWSNFLCDNTCCQAESYVLLFGKTFCATTPVARLKVYFDWSNFLCKNTCCQAESYVLLFGKTFCATTPVARLNSVCCLDKLFVQKHLLPGWKFMLFGHTFCATTPNNHCCQDDELLCYCFLNLFVKCVKYILFVGHTYTYYIGQQDEHY